MTKEETSVTLAKPTILVSKTFTFEASHVLPRHPGKCSRIHGHSWGLKVCVEGPVDPETGFVVDYARLKGLVNEAVIDKVDHSHLGYRSLVQLDPVREIRPSTNIYPTSENLLVLFAEWIQDHMTLINWPPEVHLHSLTLNETCTSEATLVL